MLTHRHRHTLKHTHINIYTSATSQGSSLQDYFALDVYIPVSCTVQRIFSSMRSFLKISDVYSKVIRIVGSSCVFIRSLLFQRSCAKSCNQKSIFPVIKYLRAVNYLHDDCWHENNHNFTELDS